MSWGTFILVIATIAVSFASGGAIAFRIAEHFYNECNDGYVHIKHNMDAEFVEITLLVFIVVMTFVIAYQL